MAGPCSVIYKGKEIPYDEFLAMLHDGLLEDFVKNEKIDTEKFTDKTWELNQAVKNGEITADERDKLLTARPEPGSEARIESLESQEESASEIEALEKISAESDSIVADIVATGESAGKPTEEPAGAEAEGANPPVGPPKVEQTPQEAAKEFIGITKTDIEAAKEKHDIATATRLFKGSDGETFWNEVKGKIENGKINPEEVIDNFLNTEAEDRVFNETYPVIGEYQYVVLDNMKSDVNEQLIDLADKNTPEANAKKAGLEIQRAIIQDKIDKTLTFLDTVTSKLGKGLGVVATRVDKQLEFAEMKRNQEAAQGKPLTPAQEKMFKEISEENDRLKARIKNLENQRKNIEKTEQKQAEQKKVEQFKEEVAKANKKRKYQLAPEKDARQKELAKKFRGEFRDVTKVATLLADKEFREYAKLTAEKFVGDFKMFSKEMIETLGQKIRPHLGDIWADIKGDEYGVKRTESEITNEFNSMVEKTIEDSEGIFHEGLFYHLQKLARNRVEDLMNKMEPKKEGETDKEFQERVNKEVTIDKIVDPIYDALSEGISDFDKQQLKDAITEYGVFKKLSKDEISRALAQAKNIGRLQSKYEATERGELPLRNGFERAEKSKEARDLERQILKNIKEKDLKQPLTAEQQAAQYKSAEAALERRLENAIADITKEIETEEKRAKTVPRKITNEKIEALKEKLDILKKQRDEMFKPKPKTEGEKRAAQIQKRIDDIRAGKVKEGKEAVYTAEEQAEINRLNQELEDVKKEYGIYPSKPLPEAKKTEYEKKIASLEKQLGDLYQGKVKVKGEKPTFTPEEKANIKTLEDEISDAKEKLGLTPAKPLPTEGKIKSLENAIDELNKKIADIAGGKEPEGPVTVKTKAGQKMFGIGKEKAPKIENERERELRDVKAALEAELSDLMPETIKNKALIDREMKRLQGRKAFLEDKLERGKSDSSVFAPNKSAEKVRLDKEGAALQRDIAILKDKVAAEREKAEYANRGMTEKAIEKASQLQQFSIFLDIYSMGKLAIAAAYRPLTMAPNELINYAASNIPGVKKIWEKQPAKYTPTFKMATESIGTYYATLFAKKTLKNAWSEFKETSEWELTKERPEFKKPKNFLDYPRRTHGFLKAFPKESKFASAYEKAMKNYANMVDPETGTYYDITDPRTLDLVKEAAKIEAKADIFMSENEVSGITNKLTNSLIQGKTAWANALGLYLSQSMPVRRVPLNFYREVIQRIPMVGLVDAATMIARSGTGEKGAPKRGVKNLTPEQASRVTEALTNQAVGISLLAIGSALYSQFGDDLLEELEEAEYWLHNPAFPLIVSGMKAQKKMDTNYNKKNTKVSLSDGEYVLKDKDGKKLTSEPKTAMYETMTEADAKERAQRRMINRYKGDREGMFETFGDIVGEMALEQSKGLPPVRTVTDMAKIIEQENAFSDKAKKMAARLLIPGASRNIVKLMDEEEKRDPKTFKELMMANIPGLHKKVPVKENWTIDSYKRFSGEELNQEEIDAKNKKAKIKNKKIARGQE